ncbi:MAG: response regulator transcription factor [Clostridia bacterium]|jgi:two-component system, OmpR family, alkaline phosphatase synthesis response regulator PhoP|nr:response regulator transcription factor [Clostridia bacterium]
MSAAKVYVVEDDKSIRELLVYKLTGSGFDVSGFATGEEGLEAILTSPPDVVLLDLMLPGIDGYEICRRVRADSKAKNTIIIMLTARGEEGDRVLGLEIGADDYISKPFSIREVVARVRAALRRGQRMQSKMNEEDEIAVGGLTILPDKREVYKGERQIALKTKEYDLLEFMMRNVGRALSRKQILDAVWGYDYYGESRTVDVHVSQLRAKIEDNPDKPELIETLRSVGYKFSDK